MHVNNPIRAFNGGKLLAILTLKVRTVAQTLYSTRKTPIILRKQFLRQCIQSATVRAETARIVRVCVLSLCMFYINFVFFVFLSFDDSCASKSLYVPLFKRGGSNVSNDRTANRIEKLNGRERRYLLTRGPMVQLRDYSDNQYVGTIGIPFSLVDKFPLETLKSRVSIIFKNDECFRYRITSSTFHSCF